jgi:hypothetical protein
MMIWLPLGLGALLLAGAVFLQRRRRRTRLARFRAEWGQASERERDMPPISLYHRTLAPPDECPLDERTGRDLDLDAVFATLDRTESAVGQQLLYHRLRTTPTSDNLAGFEAIMTRLSQDATERERIQLALARLRGASGDLWWLTQPGVLDAKRRDLVFPILAPVVPVALLLSTVWPLAVGVVIVGVLTNWTLRYLTAPRIGPLLHPFRQLEPLIGAAQTVCPVMTGGGAPLGPGLGGATSSDWAACGAWPAGSAAIRWWPTTLPTRSSSSQI